MTAEELHFRAFRNPEHIRALAALIAQQAQGLGPVRIMEVCGGHTHAIMQHGLHTLMPENIQFIHGPGCPVCVMPKARIDQAIALAKEPEVVLVTLGDMIKVPGSDGSLADARAQGAAVHFVYSPLDALAIAAKHPDKQVVFFAIGFETTTPMSAALIESAQRAGVSNLLFHINHVTVPEAVSAILDSDDAQIDALIGPSHVSVITGAQIYQPLVDRFQLPVVVSGFEPLDILEGVHRIITQKRAGEAKLSIQYTRSVTYEGNPTAQALIARTFKKRESFEWRGLGAIAQSAWQLADRYSHLDAETIYADRFEANPREDHQACLCGTILRGAAKPTDCPLFKHPCTPQNPIGSCMVSSEGACAAYYRYGQEVRL